MLILRLALIAALVAAASLAARRGGHRLSGLISGLPVVVAPITAVLLGTTRPELVRAIVAATLVCMPATLLHSLAFTWLSRRHGWIACLAGATIAYFAAAAALLWLDIDIRVAMGLAIGLPMLVPRLMPAETGIGGPVRIPAAEVALRASAASALAGAVFYAAGHLSAGIGGLVMAVPVAGAVLPSFTQFNSGHDATVRLLRGFAKGLGSFGMFFVVLYLALGVLAPWTSFALAMLATLARASWVMRR